MGTHPIFESDFDCLTDKMVTIGPGVWLLGSLWILAIVTFLLSIRSNNHLIGIGFGLAVILVTIILSVIPERQNDEPSENDETVDNRLYLKIAYCIIAPIIAMVGWGYHGVKEVYRPVRPKRIQTPW